MTATACTSPVDGATRTVLGTEEVAPLVAGITHRSVGAMPQARLAAGLVPPTNRWFSGLVFGDAPQPVFPLPLSFGLRDDGFAFGVPTVTTGADTIAAPFDPAVSVGLGAASSEVTAYDAASVTITERAADDSPLATVVIAEGSPLVSVTAASAVTLELGAPFTRASDGLWSTTVRGLDYGLASTGTLAGDASLRLKPGQSAVFVAVPTDGSLPELARHLAPLTGVTLDYAADQTSARTTLDYAASSTTLVATLPHQRVSPLSPAHCSLGSYPSVYGTMDLCATETLSWSAPALEPDDSLDLASLSASDRTALAASVRADTTSGLELPTDTYFGGKALYRLANLLDLAVQLDDTASAKLLGDRLRTALLRWTDPKGCATRESECFVYDQKVKGMVGLTASFGSEEFNDHHFHYGYFFYAASVAAKHDPALTARLTPVMTLLAADLATTGSGSRFPVQRVFDAYAGHSWASGYSPFSDGNNQESSSEAVLAWNGLALWAATVHDAGLETEARWMLASESFSANSYWTDFDRTEPVYRGYDHSIVSLNWGAKRDYSTWFSAEPTAKLAILALPMSPASGYLARDPQRVDRNLAAATANGYDVQYGDWLLMYASLGATADRDALLASARAFPPQLVDTGDSKSYLLAWVMTHAG